MLAAWGGLGLIHFGVNVMSGIANRFHLLCQT